MVILEKNEDSSGVVSGKEVLRFSHAGGPVCLDLAETLVDRHSKRGKEHLNCYLDLVAWSVERGLLTEAQARQLKKEATNQPAKAYRVYKRTVALREAIYRIFSAVADERQPSVADMDIFNSEFSGLIARSGIVMTESGFQWEWVEDDEEILDRMLWPVVRSVAVLMMSNDLDRLRECAAGDCNSLFMDTTKNRSRKWCAMKSCGNREKARKHYQKTKQTP